MNFNPWNDATLSDMLRQWWEIEGLTAGQVSVKFAECGHRFTRNAIIGRVHRLKLQPPDSKPKAISFRRSQRAKMMNVEKAKNPKHLFVIIDGKKYHPLNRHLENLMTKSPDEKPDGSRSILLKDSKEGQCKAIVGYQHGKPELAVYCGEDTVLSSTGKQTNWCSYHKKIYMTESRR